MALTNRDVLKCISDGLSAAEIAQLKKTTQTAVSKTISQLVKQGYLEEYDMPTCSGCPMSNLCGPKEKAKEKRNKVYILTEKGHGLLD